MQNLVQPHSLTLEQNVLSPLMMGLFAISDILTLIKQEDFYSNKHRVIFSACVAMYKKNDEIDPCLIAEYLRKNDLLAEAGGEDYLEFILRNSSCHEINMPVYCQKIKHYAVCRQLIKTTNEILANAYESKDMTTEDLLDFAESKVMQVQDAITSSNKQEPRVFKEVAKDVAIAIQERFNNDGQIPGMTTGFIDLDELILGLQKQTLNIVAARPAMGKTTFVMNIAERVIKKLYNNGYSKIAGLIFSLEMSDESLVEKMIASLGKIDSHKMRKGDLDDDEFNKLTNTIASSKDWPLYIDQTPAITIHDIRAKARRIYKKHGSLAYIIIDYLQLIAPSQKGFSRENEIAEISRALKALSKELDCPVIALSQLSRNVEQRANKRPVLSDLRESGQIEQDADLIMFIYRDEYYNIDSKDKGIAELIIAKQRNGNVGVIKLAANLHQSRFDNLAKESQYEHPRI